MKNAIVALSFFLIGNLYAQDTIQEIEEQNITPKVNTSSTTAFNLKEPTIYNYNNEELHFTPQNMEILITRNVNGTDSPYATLRLITDDGFYIMTSPESNDVSYGRFDSQGNFKTLRFDSDEDVFTEEIYIIGKPISGKTAISQRKQD